MVLPTEGIEFPDFDLWIRDREDWHRFIPLSALGLMQTLSGKKYERNVFEGMKKDLKRSRYHNKIRLIAFAVIGFTVVIGMVLAQVIK
ncbi:hypothetical protein MUP01_12065 [Candidatus Bathyarchaeota archaeon]|nr:hypothetical protein [Candidatus Bathyarchaeota archaeon]